MKHVRMHRAASRRTGFTLVEVSAAAVVLIITCGLLAQLLYLVAKQERSAELQQTALRAVANHLEAMQAHRWDDLPAEQKQEAAPPEVRALQPTAQLQTEVTTLEAGTARRICVRIFWLDAAGNRAEPVALFAWKQRPESASAEDDQ